MEPYRTAERPKESAMEMSEAVWHLNLARMAMVSVVLLASIASGTCIIQQRHQDSATVEAEQAKAAAAHDDAMKAMWEKMPPAKPQ
jgi:hypothetical protein